MLVIENIQEMQEKANELRSKGHTIGFVPTMGYLHQGHLELIRAARENTTTVVVSIFVNPIQFGPTEDLDRYPRDIQGDLGKCASERVDIVFMPEAKDMYPEGFQTIVSVRHLTKGLCGAKRPGHFDGVATVVTKLFNIVKPHVAFFGQKDYQQLTVISRMVRDLNMDIDIVAIPTVREKDGLAMSSRNAYLRPEERESALSLSKSLKLAQDLVDQGVTQGKRILEEVSALISSYPYTRIDYVEIVDPENLEPIKEIKGNALLAMAVFVGNTRLIDNCILKIN